VPSRVPPAARTLALVLPGAFAAYGAWAFLARGRWIAPVGGLLVAALLLLRHRRARFAAYVFLSAAAVRAAAQGPWIVVAGAVLAVLALQTRAAASLWPRLTPRWRRGTGGSRMAAR
jgi:hypothetical protein